MKASDRYSRQVLFKPIGETGQQRLAGSRAVIIGLGALGSEIASHLVRAGVGSIVLADRDFVELSNLQRQTLYDEEDARACLPKAVAAARHLELINSGVECQAVVCDVSPGNIENLIAEADVVLDGTDNFDIRFIINDTCVKLGVPWVYGGVVGASGMTMTIIPGETPCLACVFGDGGYGGGLTCDTVGVIGPAVHVIASIQAAEALKILVGDTGHLRRGLLTVDLWENEWHTIAVSEKDPNCKVCGTREFPHLRAESALQTAFLCGRDAVQVSPPKGQQVDLEALSQKLQRVAEVTRNAFLLKAIIDGREIVVFPDGRAMIKGTKDETLARSIYAKYVGH